MLILILSNNIKYYVTTHAHYLKVSNEKEKNMKFKNKNVLFFNN